MLTMDWKIAIARLADGFEAKLTRLGIRRSHHLDVPCAVGDGVRDVPIHLARHARGVALLVYEREGDGAAGHGGDVPDAVRPVVGTAVESVLAVVLLSVVCLTVDGELGFSYPVRVSPRYGVIRRVTLVAGCARKLVVSAHLWHGNRTAGRYRSRMHHRNPVQHRLPCRSCR